MKQTNSITGTWNSGVLFKEVSFLTISRETTRFQYFISKTLLDRFRTYCLKQKSVTAWVQIVQVGYEWSGYEPSVDRKRPVSTPRHNWVSLNQLTSSPEGFPFLAGATELSGEGWSSLVRFFLLDGGSSNKPALAGSSTKLVSSSFNFSLLSANEQANQLVN